MQDAPHPPSPVEDAREKFSRGELALDSYLESLVDAHRTRPAGQPPPEDAAREQPSAHVDAPPAPTRARPPEPDVTGSPAVDRWQPGRLLGARFQVQGELPADACGRRFRAQDLLTARYDPRHTGVELLVINPQISADAHLLNAALQATARQRALQHPNVAPILELHRFDGHHAVTSPLLEGETLAARMERAPIERDECREILAGISAGLEHAHRAGVVHGALGAERIVLGRDGQIRLRDFGLATVLNALDPPAQRVATPVGDCTSPDVLDGEPPGVLDDVYSVACIAYRLLAGTWPPAGQRSLLSLNSRRTEPPRPARLSRGQWRQLRSGLSTRRGDRPRSVAELVEPLLGPPRTRWQPAAWSLVAAAVIGSGLWLTLRDPPPPASPVATPLASSPADAQAVASRLPDTAPPALTEPPTPAPWPAEPAAPSPPTTAPATDSAPAVADAASQAPPPDADVQLEIPPEAASQEPAADAATITAPQATSAADQAVDRPNPAPTRRPATIGFSTTERVVVPESAGHLRLKLRVQGDLPSPVRLRVRAADAAARREDDYVLLSEEIRVERGRAEDVFLGLVADGVPENVEDLRLTLEPLEGNVRIAPDTVEVVIMDDD